MRRTRSAHLHPAAKWKLAHSITERFVADVPGVQRVEQSGGGFWGYLPHEPDVDINTYHHQIDFNSFDDIDIINLWRQTRLSNGLGGRGLGLVTIPNRTNGHAYVITSDGTGSYYHYQLRYPSYPLGLSEGETWFQCEFRARAEGAADSFVFLGWVAGGEEFPTPAHGYVGLWVYSNAETQTAVIRLRSAGDPPYTYTGDEIELVYDETTLLGLKTSKYPSDFGITWIDLYINDMETPVLRTGISDVQMPSRNVQPTFYVAGGLLGGRGFLYLNFIKSIWAK